MPLPRRHDRAQKIHIRFFFNKTMGRQWPEHQEQAARNVSRGKGADAQAYFVYGKRLQRMTSGKEPPDAADGSGQWFPK